MNKDRLYALQNLEVDVEPRVWESIEAELDRRKKRRIFFIWLLIGIAVSFSMVFSLSRRNENAKTNEINSEKFIATDEVINSSVNSFDENNLSLPKKNTKQQNVSSPPDQISNSTHEMLPGNLDRKSDNSKNNNSHTITSVKKFNSVSSLNKSHTYFSSNTNNDINSENSFETNNNSHFEIGLQSTRENQFEDEWNNDMMIEKKEVNQAIPKGLSRWTVSLLGGISHSDSKSIMNTIAENENDLRSIDHVFYEMEIKYDVSPRWALALGVNSLNIEQEWSGINRFYYPPNVTHPQNYHLYTPLGSLSGNATLLNEIVLGHDTTFPMTSSVLPQDSSLSRKIKINEQFNYVLIPLSINYKITNHRISPFVSASFSTGFLTSNSIEINDTELPFDYNEETSRTIFSSGIAVGTDIQILRRWSGMVQFQYEKQLTPVIKNESDWKPSILRFGAGVGFRF